MARRVPTALRAVSKELRGASTPAEALIWQHLRTRGLSGAKFRRQHAIGPYIVDFYCAEFSLVVEIDGSEHSDPQVAYRDVERSEFLEAQGLRVLRFSNPEVRNSTEEVVAKIRAALMPSP